MTKEQIDRQINLQKMHNARTKRATKNIVEYDRLYKAYGGMYTQKELNIISDLYPGLKAAYDNRPKENDINEIDIAEILEQLDMFTRYVQEDNYFMV